MGKFKGYIIGVLVVMACIIGLAWFLGGPERAKTFGIFFGGWIVGATSMFIKWMMVLGRF